MPATFPTHALRPLLQRISSRLRRGGRAPKATWATVATDTHSELAGMLPDIERTFLTIHTHFEPITLQSRHLLVNCEKLMRLASGLDTGSDIAQATLNLLQGLLVYIDHCVKQRDNLLGMLAQCEERTSAMLGIRTQMQATLAPLTYVSVLFKIESATLPAELRESFLTVTIEIERMRTLVDESISSNSARLQDAHATLTALRTRLDGEFKTVAASVARRRRQVDEAMQSLDSDLSRNAASDLRLHKHSQFLSEEVSRIVSSLQAQDIVHQKCTHVLEALAEPAKKYDGQAHLQASQLDAVAADLVQSHASLTAGFKRLAKTTHELETKSSKLDDLQSMTAASDGMVQMLLDTVATVQDVAREVSQLTERACEALRPMEGLAKDLSSALTELAINMRLIALNSQIRSVIDGKGTGLEQLSARTAQISTVVTELSRTNADNLTQLGLALGKLLETFHEFRERGQRELHQFETSRSACESRLHAVRDETLESFREISTTLEHLCTELGKAKASIEPLPELRERLLGISNRLHKFHREQPAHEWTAAQMEARARTYTMDSERVVHDRALGQHRAAASHATELFVDDVGSTPAAPVPDSTTEPVAVSTDAAPARSAAAPVGASTTAISANIELF